MNLLKLFTFFLAAFNIFSCKSKDKYETAPSGKSLLWEVSGNGLQKPVYVFGTIHLICAPDAKVGTTLSAVIKKADEIYFEIDMDDLGQLFSGFTMARMKNDTILSELYSKEDYERLGRFFDDHDMGAQLETVQRMQPILTSSLLYQLLLPCSETNGMELAIMKEAKPYNKEIKGLETAAFQAGILDEIPYSLQAKELLNMADSINDYRKMINEMIELYRQQDFEKLYELSTKGELTGSEGVQDIMLYKRNANWAAQFPAITKGKSLLIAVGAGHLGGDKGLINLLKQKGYTLRPLVNEIKNL
ncbi:TraB/GumN family protein [Foetidibacter luteolus]|uniref:TraB/GumN family protein n=1 Tax=Foetidibacter luteolus TaxID=2608880 RepID=UPI00129A14EE|nr:TraB/GumN family protein [Foetidibacter luteolus]